MTGACAGGHALVRRDTAELTAVPTAHPIAWYSPAVASDGATLARWRGSVGPPVVDLPASQIATPANRITVVSWNTHLGGADVIRFVSSLRADGPLVLLLQEVYRGGPEVPRTLARGASYARRQGGAAEGPRSQEIEAIAHELGLALYYVPSMRNGGPSASDEDRGNAILSNLPLSDLAAIELPFEHQRRVAVAATIAGQTTGGEPWRVRVVSAHLDNTVSARHAWIGGEYGRTRQVRGLTDLFRGDDPTILAGDFNTWFGFSDRTFLETAQAFPDTRIADRRATFYGLLRLDHFFFRLAPGWRAEFRRADDRFGSDHFPLVGSVTFH